MASLGVREPCNVTISPLNFEISRRTTARVGEDTVNGPFCWSVAETRYLMKLAAGEAAVVIGDMRAQQGGMEDVVNAAPGELRRELK